ncbi:hypothetical protein BB558_001992 [Smittium angustum]|uniref:Core-binding (CB) domain-containing protein n=1 Tax=Smittium angustum TaxID=133377 RepID=A0A2U1J9X8_SMIAN|nr:hypothetical protein BB558_001992 [Smittium angustum]
MDETTANLIRELTKKVDELLIERANARDPEEDQHITARIPITDLNVYPELIEALPSIEEDFFRTPMTEEEKKEAIFTCPRTSAMNYQPPPLNDSASSAVKKADSILYGIQVALAQATRPIDYYVHRRIQEDPKPTEDDPHIALATTMRILLSDIAATVTQDRLDNLHKGMELPGKPHQLVESDTKPLMNPENTPALSWAPAVCHPNGYQQQHCNGAESPSCTGYYSDQHAQQPPATRKFSRKGPRPGKGVTIETRQDPPVGGRLAMFRTAWSKLTDSRWVQGIVSKGFQIPFKNPETPEPCPLARKTKSLHGAEISTPASKFPRTLADFTDGPFRSAADFPPTQIQAEIEPGSQQGIDRRSSYAAGKESHRGNSAADIRILQSAIYNPKEDWRPSTGARPKEAQPTRGRAEFQDGDPIFHLQNDQTERLLDFSGPPGRIHAYTDLQGMQKVSSFSLERKGIPISSATVWTIAESSDIHQGASTSTSMGQIKRNSNLGIPRRLVNHGGVQGDVYDQYTISLLQTLGAWVQDQRREIINNAISIHYSPRNGNQHQVHVTQGPSNQDTRPQTRSQQAIEGWPNDVEMFSELHRESPINVSSTSSGPTYATPTIGTEEQLIVNGENMDVDSNLDGSSYPKPTVLEEPTKVMERAIVLARDTRDGDLYRLQRLSLRDSYRLPFILRTVDKVGGKDAYQCQGAADSVIRTEAQTSEGSFGVNILGQHNDISICEEVRGHNLSRPAENSREYLELLHENEHETASDIRPIGSESCGRTEQIDCPNRMVPVNGNLQDAGIEIRTSRRGSVCLSPEQEGGPVLQLVCGQQSARPELTSLQMVGMEQPLLLPPVELDCTDSPEGATGTSNDDHSDSDVEVGNVVSRPDVPISVTAVATTSHNSDSGPKKRKVSALGKQALALDGMEDQRRFLETQGLGNYAIDCILSNERRIRRRSRYSSIQQRFLDWRISNGITTEISTSQIINYLAEIYTVDKLKVSSIKAYKSAILRLAKNPEELSADPVLSEFTKTLDESSIRSFVRPNIDISPILELFRTWGPTDGLTDKQLTSKLSWLLSVTGFLRASDIHRIDDGRTRIEKKVLKLIIVAPKEKRGGRPVEKPCQINSHIDPILCPVIAYKIYKERIAREPCPSPHEYNNGWIINRLFRFINDYARPLSVDSISRYIHQISNLISRDPGTPRPKGRAIGATLAANAGVSSDDIVSHAFWSNYTIFDTYYRLTRNNSNNLTESILNLE